MEAKEEVETKRGNEADYVDILRRILFEVSPELQEIEASVYEGECLDVYTLNIVSSPFGVSGTVISKGLEEKAITETVSPIQFIDRIALGYHSFDRMVFSFRTPDSTIEAKFEDVQRDYFDRIPVLGQHDNIGTIRVDTR